MDMYISILSGIVVVFAIYFYSLYAGIIQNKNNALEALSGIDVQLRKRYDLIPNILTIAKKFMEHEQELFGKITELRSQASKAPLGSKEKFQAESALDTQLKALMVNVENYPTLKSDETMIQAMQTYNEVEENIAAARRFYNSSIKVLRNSVEIFPGCLFASCAGKALELEFFETDIESKNPINASQYL